MCSKTTLVGLLFLTVNVGVGKMVTVFLSWLNSYFATSGMGVGTIIGALSASTFSTKCWLGRRIGRQ